MNRVFSAFQGSPLSFEPSRIKVVADLRGGGQVTTVYPLGPILALLLRLIAGHMNFTSLIKRGMLSSLLSLLCTTVAIASVSYTASGTEGNALQSSPLVGQ